LNYFGSTDVGKVRKNNEDSFITKLYDNGLFIAIVADGMGGHAAGEYASSIAIESISSSFDEISDVLISCNARKIKTELKKILNRANSEVASKAKESSELNGMGTTVVMCVIIKDKIYIANVGDSRCYVIDKTIRQITKDHSLVAELIDAGVITKEQANDHPQRNIITRAIGTDLDVDPDIFVIKLESAIKLLLCSDGLTNMISDNTIFNVLNTEPTCNDAVNSLIDKANKRGGNDNITAVIIEFDGGVKEK